MLEQLRIYLANIFAPGVEESKNDQIKLIIGKNLSFKVDMESFRDSTEVKRQLRLSAEEKRA
ncbi:hypothetical protein H5159_01130 [Pseudoalteromonas sp. SG43-1]|uniref:hypothetical protein n=1 Tax=Pseudoalteromonas sp. SG43-1 TaxID=2760971 RepID=UPI00160346CF|nr:hypothetical protein [Pseudoalteromonas sp. SG43-1]MBB1449689.1 hypothetical protein [Pseudoalteromonas sp. SG43-1]